MPATTFGFLGNPESVVTGSGAYEIPVGKYGYISACAYNGTVTINGTTWLSGGLFLEQSSSVGTSGTLTVSVDGLYSVITGGAGALTALTVYSGSATGAISLLSGGNIVNTNGPMYLAAGDVIAATFASGSNSIIIRGMKNGITDAPVGNQWLEAGDDVNTTGDASYTVSIFAA